MDKQVRQHLVVIKLKASSGTSSLEGIKQLRTACDFANNVDFARYRIEVGVYIELSIRIFEEIVDIADQLLHGPPPYHQNASELHDRLLEIKILAFEVADHVEALQQKLEEMCEKTHMALEVGIEEVICKTLLVSILAQRSRSMVRVLKPPTALRIAAPGKARTTRRRWTMLEFKNRDTLAISWMESMQRVSKMLNEGEPSQKTVWKLSFQSNNTLTVVEDVA